MPERDAEIDPTAVLPLTDDDFRWQTAYRDQFSPDYVRVWNRAAGAAAVFGQRRAYRLGSGKRRESPLSTGPMPMTVAFAPKERPRPAFLQVDLLPDDAEQVMDILADPEIAALPNPAKVKHEVINSYAPGLLLSAWAPAPPEPRAGSAKPSMYTELPPAGVNAPERPLQRVVPLKLFNGSSVLYLQRPAGIPPLEGALPQVMKRARETRRKHRAAIRALIAAGITSVV